MIIVSPSTVLNPAALETRGLPKRMLGRIAVLPRRTGPGTWARLLFEMQLLRYLVPLVPFVAAMLIWPHLALPISQAPIPMMLVIAVVETRVLTLRPALRETVIDDAAMARGLDAWRFNARSALMRIAAHRDLTAGELHLVVEQSLLARVPPLTLVSVQAALPSPAVLDLDPEERAILREALFADGLDPRTLHRIALREGEGLRSVVVDASSITAHARMAARLAGARRAEAGAA